MKRFIIVIMVTTLLAVSVFAFLYHSMNSYGFEDISAYDGFKEYADGLQVMLDDTEPEDVPEIENEFFRLQSSPMPLLSASCVLEATAETSYMQKGNFYLQDVIVDNVIEGDASLAGKRIYISRAGGLIGWGDLGKPYIRVSENIMEPEQRYLIFCRELNISIAPDLPVYEVSYLKFRLLRIDKDDTEAVSGYEQEDGMYYADYKAYAGQEFFATSKETLLGYIKIKHDIFKKYGVE